MLVDEDKSIAFSTHALMLGLNAFCVYLVMVYVEDHHLFIRGMHVSDGPAQLTVILFALCTIAMDAVYIKGIIKQCKKTHNQCSQHRRCC